MKYIVIKVGEYEVPIIFSELIFHMDIAKLISNTIISAGFVEQGTDGKLRCFGKSDGLSIWSRPVPDAQLINDDLVPWQSVIPLAAKAGKT